MNYTNREVVRKLKQYDLFLNSLNLTQDKIQRERICDQLDKIEEQILLETNAEYEEEYMILMNQDTKYFEEEKARLRNLISLIVDRKNYLEERKIRHKGVTGSIVELTTFLGEDKLTTLKKRLEVIEKYEENKSKQESLIKDMKALDIKISEASRNVKANMRLNDSLENKMIALVGKALERLDLYKLLDKKVEINNSYEAFKYASDLAKDNLKRAREEGNVDMILSCDNMLSEVTIEFSKYNTELNIIKLINVYDRKVQNYDELLEKREEIDDILKNITESDLYTEINDELCKQFNTIKLEKQDIKSYDLLKDERERKNKLLYEIDEENNSKEFKSVLEELIKNENRLREEQIRIAKKKEYQERQKKLAEEQKIEAARVRRQKLIEEARLKDQLERAEKIKELQKKTVINKKKEEDKEVTFVPEPKENAPLPNFIENKGEENTNVSDDFDTDELFENTKIVPNKPITSEEKDEWKIENSSLVEDISREAALDNTPIWTPSSDEVVENKEITSNPEEKVKTLDIMDLFKEEREKKKDVSISNDDDENVSTSIYDILEGNKNIIWKTTEPKSDVNSIPVIENNNLKPQIVDNKKKEGLAFPDIEDKKGGEVLWKETL